MGMLTALMLARGLGQRGGAGAPQAAGPMPVGGPPMTARQGVPNVQIDPVRPSMTGAAAAPAAPSRGGLLGAFSGAPAFQNQLGAIMQGQGPGMQAPQFTPPRVPLNTTVPGAGRGGMGQPSDVFGGSGLATMFPGFGAGMGGDWMGGGQMSSLLSGDNVNWTPPNWFGRQDN